MNKVIVHKQQNILDLAIQEYGSVEGLLELAKENNLSLDEDMVAGSVLIIDEAKIINLPLVDYFKEKEIVIATGVNGLVTNDTGIFDDTFNDTFN